MKWNKFLSAVLFVSMAATGLQAQGSVRMIDPARLVTPVEGSAIRVAESIAARHPGLAGVAAKMRAQNAAGGLNLTNPKMAAAAVLALAGTIPGLSQAQLEAAIAAEMSAPQTAITFQAPQGADASLAFMSELSAKDAGNCGLAMGKAPVNADVSADQKIIISSAETAVSNYIQFAQFYGLNNAQLQDSLFDLVNSGADGAMDFEVTSGLGSLYSFILPATADAIAKLSADGDFSAADQELVQTCSVYLGVESLAASHSMPSKDGSALAEQVAGACAVPLTGKPAPSSFESCRI